MILCCLFVHQSTICFKGYLLNYSVEFHQTSQELSLDGRLSKMFNDFNPHIGNPGVTHSVPNAFINDECSRYGMGHDWVTEDV